MNILQHLIKLRSRSFFTLVILITLFVFSSLLLVYLLHDKDWEFIRKADLNVLSAILFLTALLTLTYTWLVHLLVRSSGYVVSLWKTYLVLSASLSANYLTPLKIGVPFRVYLYYQLMGIPVTLGTALMTIELLISILLPALFAIIGIVLIFPSLGLIPPIILIVLLLAAFLAILRVQPEVYLVYLEQLRVPSFTLRLIRFIQDVQYALQQISLVTILCVVVLVALMIGMQIVRLWLILGIFGSSPSLFALLAVFTISVMATNLSLIPMGLGVREASLTLLLMQLNVPGEIALSVAVIERLISSGLSLVTGIIAINILGVTELVVNSGDLSPVNK